MCLIPTYHKKKAVPKNYIWPCFDPKRVKKWTKGPISKN